MLSDHSDSPYGSPEGSDPIIVMLCCMFCLLLLGGLAIAVLLAGRQSMKANVQQKEYRERLFKNLCKYRFCIPSLHALRTESGAGVR